MKAMKNARKRIRDVGSSTVVDMANISGSPSNTTDQLDSTRLSRNLNVMRSRGESGNVNRKADSRFENKELYAMIALEKVSSASMAAKKKLKIIGTAIVASSGVRSS